MPEAELHSSRGLEEGSAENSVLPETIKYLSYSWVFWQSLAGISPQPSGKMKSNGLIYLTEEISKKSIMELGHGY